jgi:hypothetical protein
MHWKLFATIVAAAVVAYLIIRWLRSCLDAPQFAIATPKREIGFAAVMKSPSPA